MNNDKPTYQELERKIEQLSKSNFLFKSIFKQLPMGIQIFDNEGLLYDINDAQKEFSGMFDIKSNIGKLNILKENNSVTNGLDKIYEQVYNGIKVQHQYEKELYIEDNQLNTLKEKRIYFETIFPIINNENQVEFVVSVLNYIKSENKEQQSQTLDNMIEGCQIIGFDWKYIYINNAAEKHNNKSKSELIGKKYTDIWSNIQETEVFQHISCCMEERTIQRFENKFNFPDGSVGWFELSIQPIPEGVLILSSDITEKKRTEEELILKNTELAASKKEIKEANKELISTMDILKETNASLLIAIENAEQSQANLLEAQIISKVGNWNLNLLNQEFTWSKMCYSLFEIDENINSKNLKEEFLKKIHPDDLDKYLKIFEDSIKKSEGFTCELRFIINHLIKYILVIANPVKNSESSLIGLKGILKEITEQKKLEQELILAKEKAEESDRLKTAFLNNMSHEVRTPLNAIAGFSNFISKSNLTQEKLQTFSGLIASSSQKLIDIITDIIEISQIHTNQSQTVLVAIDIIQFLNFTVSSFTQRAKEKKLELNLNIHIPHKEYQILADIDKLKRIFSHLIDNALKFTQQGKIEISCRINTDKLQVSISDTGIGISEEMQKVIFQPFMQAETGISRNYGGNGLGLSIVKAYIDLIKGSISLKSELNKGTTFTVTFPAVNTFIQTTHKFYHTDKQAINTVLIAEDEYSNYLYLEEFLDGSGLEILYAANGEQAIDICRNNESVDLILMDIKMPIMDGHTASKIIKEFRLRLPIIALTAYALQNEKTKYSNDFDDYITKPIDEGELKQKLIKYIGWH